MQVRQLVFLGLSILWFATSSAFGQGMSQAELDKNIELMRANVRYEKSNWIRSNVPMTEHEAEVFWPLYRRYQMELTKVGEERIALIKEYAANHDSLSDSRARALLDRSFSVDSKLQTLRRLYKNEFLTVVPPKVVARFFQVEHRLNLLIDLEVAAQIPLVESKEKLALHRHRSVVGNHGGCTGEQTRRVG